MGNITFNRSLGKIHQYAENVDSNTPAASVLRMFALVSTDTDNTTRDLATMTITGLLALSLTAEATNSGYANQVLTDANVTVDIDDTNDRVDIQFGDVTFSSVVGGDNWTHIVIGYDDTGADNDGLTIPLTRHDFVVTPNGGDITANDAADGFWSSSN
jgi:hypothetical protein